MPFGNTVCRRHGIMFLNEVLSPVLSGEQVAPNLLLYIGLGVVAILLMIPFHWLQYGSVFIATYNESANKRVTLAEKLRKLLTYFMFLMAATRIYDPLSGVLANIAEIFNARLKISRMQEIESQPIQEGATEYSVDGFDIVFDHVFFAYNNDEPVLSDVSFTAKQGEITALVGPSGSGKSTAAKLTARFWDVSGGRITLGGTDIKTVDPESLLKNYAIVFQDVVLFDNTVMENIRIGRKDASDKEVVAAAKAAQCEEFINRLPEGYHTVIGENGAILSGGERQRLSIARAILKNAPVILLDEATASLDVESETMVQEAISQLIAGKTVLIIAHRMRTVAGADKIVVLSDGKVEQMGSPDELVQFDGMYKRMAILQEQSASWSLSKN